MKNARLFILIMILFNSCKKEEPRSCNDGEGLFRSSKFPIGTAVNMDNMVEGSAYKNIANEQFNSITAENIFKAEFIHPQENVFNWSEADALAGYCEYHNKRLHGHTLIWHSQLPLWIKNFEGNEEQWEHLFRNHIQTIVSYYKGRVKGWDVVNEAFNDDGTLRESIWREHLGDTYIEKAFRYAQEADPTALLFYNDYLPEINPLKRKTILKFLNDLRSRGVKVDGIGVQCHISTMYPDVSQVVEAIHEIADNGFMVHLSEVDISVNPLGKEIDLKPGDELFKTQANILGAIVMGYKELESRYRYGITFWGISDKDSWIPAYFNRKDYPLLYDQDYIPKPAYCKLKDIL